MTTPSLTPATLRPDFRAEIERRFDAWLGPAGTDRRANLELMFESVLTEAEAGPRRLDWDRLPESATADIRRLAGAAEGVEAMFLKDLLAQMRRNTFAERPSPMAGMAHDMMDRAVAEAASASGRGVGIARTVFMAAAEPLVRRLAAPPQTNLTTGPENQP